ncbi:MAG: TAXI family TRAP transporter solute-binding subunit [Clostridia bacterium]|nr:TAXI family TRAP transporter solute-binding subunit [Clostridia bacterium]MBQ9996214.1 TAXI family TRAP transporter solute-binding subunit [Clostridia bacterium]
MKKTLSMLLAVVMMAAMVLTSCGGGSEKIFLATGSETGTYYSFGIALGQVMKDKIGQEFGVQSTGASKANIQLVADGDVSMAIVQNDVMDYAFNGTNTFAEEGAISGFSAVATLYAEVIQIVAKPGITSVADLKGKTVSVGDAGSGTEFNAAQIFEAYGMTFDDINKQSLGFTDSADKFKDGQLDAFFVTAGAPTTCITDLATSNDFVILSIGETEMQYLKDNYGYYTEYTLTAGTYDKQTEDATTVAVKATLIAADTLSEDTVYNVTKGIFENVEAIKATHAKGAELSADNGVQGISVPFHPGAEKYFKEIGKLS